MRLDRVCQIIMGQAPDGETYNFERQGWPLIAGAGDFGEQYPNASKFTTKASKLSRQGDIILGIRATIGEKILSDGEYCLGRGVAGLRAKAELNPRFLWHWLGHVRPELSGRAKGATFKQVSREDIAALEITVPSSREQRRIAEILDRAEALRAKRREALAKLDTLLHSVFFNVFGDLRSHELVPLESLAASKPNALSSGPFGSNLTCKDYVDDGVLVLRGLNVTGGEVSLHDCKFISRLKADQLGRSIVAPGDIVIVAVGTSGFACVIPDEFPDAVMSQNFNKISPDMRVVNTTYLCSVVNSEFVQRQFRQNITDTVRTFLSLTKLRTVSIPLPPLPLQQEFARRVAAIEKLKAAHRASLAEMDALFASLQHRAFRGEL